MSKVHLLLLVLVNACWGFNFIAAKVGTAAYGPFLFITLRFAVVLILLFPFLRWTSGQMRVVMLVGLSMGVGHYSLMFYSISLAGSLSAIAIAAQLTVPMSTILAIVFLGERIGTTRAVAISAAFVGVLIIAYEPVGTEQIRALLFATAASFCMAIAAILMRRLKAVPVFSLQAWIALIATVCMGTLTWFVEHPTFTYITSVPVTLWWTPVYSAIGATIVGHGLLYSLLQRYPVNSIAPFISLTTLFSIGFSVMLLDEVLTTRILLGGIVTLSGVTIVAIRNAPGVVPTTIRVPR